MAQQGIQLEQLVGLQTSTQTESRNSRNQNKIHPSINIVYSDYLKDQANPALNYLQSQNKVENLEISSLSFMNSETSTVQINYINQDACDDLTFRDLVKKPYLMLMLITDANIKDYKKNGYPQMEKFVELCQERGVIYFLFVFCPILDQSMKKARGLESKIAEILNEIISDGETKLNIQRNRFLKLIDIDPQTSSDLYLFDLNKKNDSKEFSEFCKREFQMILRSSIKESIEERISQIENDIFSYNEKKQQTNIAITIKITQQNKLIKFQFNLLNRNLSDWNYQLSLLKKERLIKLLNALGLHQEALQLYEEFNNTIYEIIMRGKLNSNQYLQILEFKYSIKTIKEMDSIENNKENLIPVINSTAYDNYDAFSQQINQKRIHFFKFYQILIRKIIIQMTSMLFIQELMDRLQYFLRFIQSNIFSQMNCESENIKLFQNVWIILTINQIIEFFVEQKKSQSYAPQQLNDIDYNIILLREIQLTSMQKIAEMLFSVSLQDLGIQSIEQEFQQLQTSVKTNKLRRLKSFIKEKDLSHLTVLSELNEQSTFAKTFSDSTLFFNSYTTIISDQIISLNKLKILIYQNSKFLQKKSSTFYSVNFFLIPHKALAIENEEVYKTLEAWPDLLVTGLIYKLLFYKNHCVVEQLRKCCIKLIKLKILTLNQRNLVLNIMKEDNEKSYMSNEEEDSDGKGNDEYLEDLSKSLGKKSSSTIQKYFRDEISEPSSEKASPLKKDNYQNDIFFIQKKKKKKYIKVENSELCFVEKFQLEKTHGQTYEGKIRIQKLFDFSLQDIKIEVKLESSTINRISRYSQDEYDRLQKQSPSKNGLDTPKLTPQQYEIIKIQMLDCEFNEQTYQSISKEVEILAKGCFSLQSVSLIIGQYKFKLIISDKARQHIHKINLPSLNICSLIDSSRIEIPYYHEIPILVSIIDHDFKNITHLKLVYNHEVLKLEKKYICLSQGSEKGQIHEQKVEFVHKDIIQLTQNELNINKMAIIVYFKAQGKNSHKIDHGTFTSLNIKLIEDTNILDQFEKQAITCTYYQQDIKKLDIFYNISITNLSDYDIKFSNQNYSQSTRSTNDDITIQKNEKISKTINPQNGNYNVNFKTLLEIFLININILILQPHNLFNYSEKVYIRFNLNSEILNEVAENNFVDDLSFLKSLNIEKYFIEKEISKDTILKDSTLIKNPKLDIFVNNIIPHCFQNEIMTLQIKLKILISIKQNTEDKVFFTLLAVNKREGNYLLLGQTQISTQNGLSEYEWKLQILPIKCGVFYLPEFEVIEYRMDDHQQLTQDKINSNQYILRYYSEPVISVTSDSSQIKNSSAYFS